MKKGLTISPIFTFRSPLPIATIDGRDLNSNWSTNDLSRQGLPVHGLRGHDRRGRAPGDLQGARHLRNLELQPRRVEDADEPARRRTTSAWSARAASSSSARCSTCSTPRTRAASTPRSSPPTGAPNTGVHAADDVRRRLPGGRTARRADRLPVLASNDSCQLTVREPLFSRWLARFGEPAVFFWIVTTANPELPTELQTPKLSTELPTANCSRVCGVRECARCGVRAAGCGCGSLHRASRIAELRTANCQLLRERSEQLRGGSMLFRAGRRVREHATVASRSPSRDCRSPDTRSPG